MSFVLNVEGLTCRNPILPGRNAYLADPRGLRLVSNCTTRRESRDAGISFHSDPEKPRRRAQPAWHGCAGKRRPNRSFQFFHPFQAPDFISETRRWIRSIFDDVRSDFRPPLTAPRADLPGWPDKSDSRRP